MNKELIKTYSKEFNHWINGGKLLAKHDNKGWINYYGEDIWTHSAETLIVIDDEYSMFRKALIEGESIEVLQSNTERWVNIGTIIESIKPELYRIKPNKQESPKFEVGDWVRDLRDNRIFQINSENFNLNLSITNGVYVHWQPKPGEWCWFHNGISSSLVFAMFYNSNSFGYWIDEDECDIITSSEFYTYKYCEPFTGNLPTIILN